MSEKKYILSIDQGTTSSRACLFDFKGCLVAQHSQTFEQIFPSPGWVEHRPEEIWSSVEKCIIKVLKKAHASGNQIHSIGITNQRETTVMWEIDGHRPIYNAIVWQCRRTADQCRKLKKNSKLMKEIKSTGLLLDPYFSATKIQWILKNVVGANKLAKENRVKVGTIDSFLLWKLTSGKVHKTDVTNASRTMLMNLKTLKWSEPILKILNIPAHILPEICDSNSNFGKTYGLDFLPDGISITGVIGDQQAALFGQVAFAKGDVKCTFGTGSFMLLNTGEQLIRSRHQLLSTVAWKLQNQKPIYAIEGGAYICGAAVQWLRDGLKIIESSKDIEALAQSVPDSGGVEFIPALTGLGAPYWQSEARGLITGITRGTHRGHIARATLEAMALQNVEILEAMQSDLKDKLKIIKVDGGATANHLLMQIQSNFMGMKVVQPIILETTALGAAYLSGLGAGVWKNTNEIKGIWKSQKEFKPEISLQKRRLRLKSWKEAIVKTFK